MPRKRTVEVDEAATFKPGGVVISARLEPDVAKRLLRLAETTQQPVSSLVRDAIRAYVDPGGEDEESRSFVLNYLAGFNTLFEALTINTRQDLNVVRAAIGAAEQPRLNRPVATGGLGIFDRGAAATRVA